MMPGRVTLSEVVALLALGLQVDGEEQAGSQGEDGALEGEGMHQGGARERRSG
jgi:hypothetical protein